MKLLFAGLASQPCGPSASSVVLSAAVQRHPLLREKIQCSFVDIVIGRDDVDNILWRIVSEKPDIICFSLYIWNICTIETLIYEISAMLPSAKIAVGGPASGMLSPGIHKLVWICSSRLGEGPFVNWLCELIGISNDESLQNPMKCSPYLNRIDSYISTHPSKEMIVYDASRGCPFSCTFCHDGQKDMEEIHRPAKVIFEEMKYLASLGYLVIDVSDNNANLNQDSFSAYMKVAEDCPNTVIHTEVRGELFDKEQAIAAANIPNFQMFMGIQTVIGNEAKAVGRHNKLEKLKKLMLEWIPVRNRRAIVGLEILFGLPGQTKDSFGISFDFVTSLCPNKISLYHYKRFPWDHSGEGSVKRVLSREFRLQIAETSTLSVDDIAWCILFKKIFYTLQAAGQWTTVANTILTEQGKSRYSFYCEILEKCESAWSLNAVVSSAASVARHRLGVKLGAILEDELEKTLRSIQWDSVSPLWHRCSDILERCKTRGI